MQRSTSTEAMGRGLESILAEDEGTSESEEEAEAKLWLEINAAAGIFWRQKVSFWFLVRRCFRRAESVQSQGRRAVVYLSCVVFRLLFRIGGVAQIAG